MHFQTSAIPQAQQIPLQAQPQPQAPPAAPPTPEPVKQKLPIPEEYMYMQTVFNELRVECINSAVNPVSFSFPNTKERCTFFFGFFLANQTKTRRCGKTTRMPL